MTPLSDWQGDLTSLSIIIGMVIAATTGFWRLVIRPQLMQILDNVSKNGHTRDQPTMPDRLNDVRAEIVGRLDKLDAKVDAKFDAVDSKLDGHMLEAAATDATRAAENREIIHRLNRAGI